MENDGIVCIPRVSPAPVLEKPDVADFVLFKHRSLVLKELLENDLRFRVDLAEDLVPYKIVTTDQKKKLELKEINI